MEQKPNEHKFLEIETKYDADTINRLEFKKLMESLCPTSFLYIESEDVYYVKSENEFLRHRKPPKFGETKRSELTFKKKHVGGNNNVRTEVNLRVDDNSPETIEAFCNGLGYTKNFSIVKNCDIYWYGNECDVVFYNVTDESGKIKSFLEIEVLEDSGFNEEQAWEIISKYEKLLAPLGISAQKRKRLSLFEIYRKVEKNEAK